MHYRQAPCIALVSYVPVVGVAVSEMTPSVLCCCSSDPVVSDLTGGCLPFVEGKNVVMRLYEMSSDDVLSPSRSTTRGRLWLPIYRIGDGAVHFAPCRNFPSPPLRY